jgi:hypothetical protein
MLASQFVLYTIALYFVQIVNSQQSTSNSTATDGITTSTTPADDNTTMQLNNVPAPPNRIRRRKRRDEHRHHRVAPQISKDNETPPSNNVVDAASVVDNVGNQDHTGGNGNNLSAQPNANPSQPLTQPRRTPWLRQPRGKIGFTHNRQPSTLSRWSRNPRARGNVWNNGSGAINANQMSEARMPTGSATDTAKSSAQGVVNDPVPEDTSGDGNNAAEGQPTQTENTQNDLTNSSETDDEDSMSTAATENTASSATRLGEAAVNSTNTSNDTSSTGDQPAPTKTEDTTASSSSSLAPTSSTTSTEMNGTTFPTSIPGGETNTTSTAEAPIAVQSVSVDAPIFSSSSTGLNTTASDTKSNATV